MLIRDVLQVIFEFLCEKDAKSARLVCRVWDDLLRSRFVVFNTNTELLTLPDQCTILVRRRGTIPKLHPNIKKATIYIKSIIISWDQEIDSLFIHGEFPGFNVKINCSVNDLTIGLFIHNFIYKNAKNINFDVLISDVKSTCLLARNVYITSLETYERNAFVYIKPGSVIDRLLIGASHLHIVDLDATINKLYIANESNETTITVYKKGVVNSHKQRGGLTLVEPSRLSC